MTTISTEDPPFQSAIEACAVALKWTVEKLEAQTALSRLRATLPGLLSESWVRQWEHCEMNHPDLVSIRHLLDELGVQWRVSS